MREVETDWELSRQLTFALLTANMVKTNQENGRVNLWHSDALGKAVMTYADRIENADPRLTPYQFSCLRVRPDIGPGQRPNALIYSDIPAEQCEEHRGKQPRYFGVRFKIAPMAKDIGIPLALEGLIKEILSTQIVPVIGVTFDREPPCYIFALHYDPEEKSLRPILIDQVIQQFLSVPAVALNRGKNLFPPNFALVSQLLAYLLDPPVVGAYAHNARVASLRRIRPLMSQKFKFLDIVEKNDIVLSEEERSILTKLDL